MIFFTDMPQLTSKVEQYFDAIINKKENLH